jgi:hypothetical protein
MTRRLLATVLSAAAWLGMLGAAPTPVAASCAAPSSPADAARFGEIVFVGSVTELANEGRWVKVKVEERWRGASDLPDQVEVRGGPEPGTGTDIDRSFLAGRYLFVVEQGPGYLLDNQCSGTILWYDTLADLRPSGVKPAFTASGEESPPGQDILPVVALFLAAGIALVAYILILRSRARPPDWMR